MMSATGYPNRAMHDAVARAVAGYLADAGLDGAHPRPWLPRTMSEALGEDAIDGDVRGIPGAWIGVTSRLKYRPTEELNRARTGASLLGRDFAIAVQWKGGAPVADALCTIALSDLAKLLRSSSAP